MTAHEHRKKDRPMTVEEAADMLMVSVKTAYGWVCAKRIPHLKPSRSILRFRRSDIEAWLDNKAVEERE